MRGYACVGLHNAKNPINVGEALQATGVYDAAMVAVSGKRYHGAITDKMKAYRHMPLIQTENLQNVIPYDCVPVAVDLIDGAIALPKYEHPERAFYIFGPEDGTLGKGVLDYCRDIVYIPTKACMNLAATVNVVLYDRMVNHHSHDQL